MEGEESSKFEAYQRAANLTLDVMINSASNKTPPESEGMLWKWHESEGGRK